MCNFILVFLALSSCLPLLSQTESLLIGPGDVLHVRFYDTPDLEQHPRVDDAGNIPLLFLGRTAVAGKTPEAAAKAIEAVAVAKDFMRHPQVVVTIDQYATQDVAITGEVNKPGKYPIATSSSVIDVLSMAGGLNVLADRHIMIRHHDPGTAPTSYFVSNDGGQALHDDVTIRPGDTIVVSRVGFVYVLGDVGRPGGYPMTTNESRSTLMQTLAMAGSPNKTASMSRVKLIRKTSSGYVDVPFHLEAIEQGREPDLVLEANDVIFVPLSYAKNFVLNATTVAASVGSAVLYKF